MSTELKKTGKTVLTGIITLAIVVGIVMGALYFIRYMKETKLIQGLLNNPATNEELSARAVKNKTTLQQEAKKAARAMMN